LQNTQGSNGFLGDDDVSSLLGGGLPFLLVFLRDLGWGVGLLLTPSWEAYGFVVSATLACCWEIWAGYNVEPSDGWVALQILLVLQYILGLGQ
jgi:hypothetical protein